MTLFLPCAGSGARLGLGGAPLGNLFAPVADDAARALLDAAWASGCRSFDTAPHYGHGLSERRIGDALRAHERASFVLSSKVGRVLTPSEGAPREQHGYVGGLPFVQHWNYSAAGVRRSVEDSLQRLGLARLDVAYVHDCDAATHGADAAAVLRRVCDETLPALRALQGEGLVGAVGLGVNDVAIVLDVLRHADLDALLIAGRYTLLDHAALHALWPACRQRGIHVALGGVFNSGLLASGTRCTGVAPARFDYAPAALPWIERTRRIEALCAAHRVPLRAAALQFALAHPAIEIVLVGARSAAEWHDTLAMAAQPIDAGFWPALRSAGLLPDEAPTP
jgi:D-threo-aldose 1-dehydrogenase